MSLLRSIITLIILQFSLTGLGQTTISGVVRDEKGNELPFVNIGIKGKNCGTFSNEQGVFSLMVSRDNINDTLHFSLLGFHERHFPIKQLLQKKDTIIMTTANIALNEVVISDKKLVEKKFGITKYKSLIHFIDASTKQDDIFEVAQLFHLPRKASKITKVNLFINESRKDSGIFRVNFYHLENDQPSTKLNERDIIQKKPIREGWLTFDLSDYGIYLGGDIVVGVEFIPSGKKDIKYEVKVGGSSRSYTRTSSLGDWHIPPHHYKMYITALVSEENKTDGNDDIEAAPTHILYSKDVNDSFYIYVSLPKDYSKNNSRTFPVAYVVDGNFYFDLLKDNKDWIIIGVGYRNAFRGDTMRDRDFTFPKSIGENGLISGGAKEFLTFIQKDLIPFVDGNYRTDVNNRMLLGHSLGGYFVLFALLSNWESGCCFNSYVAASPSIEYANGYLLTAFKTKKQLMNSPISLYISTGENEYTDQVRSLVDDLSTTPIHLKHKHFPKHEHMETAIPTFRKALTNANAVEQTK